MINGIKTGLGRIIQPLSRSRRLAEQGQGGSARFAGLADEWAHPFRPGGILMGQSLHDPSWRVGLEKGNILTCASPGSGKGFTRTNPNLLFYPHNVGVIDVKGTHTMVTAAARGHGGGRVRNGMGQNVYVLDPFGITAGRPGVPKGMRFDPLAAINPDGLMAVDDIKNVATGLIASSDRGTPHWTDSARNLVAGLCGYVKTAPLDEKDGVKARTLVEVRRLLTSPDGPPIRKMAESNACGGIVSRGAAQIRAAGREEKAGILSTAIEQCGWIDSLPMQNMLSGNDFDLDDLKRKPSTLYLVIPPQYLATHGRFLRLFINLTLKMAGRIGSAGHPLLMIMDEFYSLGRLDAVAEAAANIRSYGVRLWPQVQGLGQIRELYGENWETFISNLEIFGVNELTTARYAAEMLGHIQVMREDRDGVKRAAAVASLRDAAELAHEVAADGDRMVVFRGGPDPFLLRRLPYSKIFSKSQYNPDPDVEGS